MTLTGLKGNQRARVVSITGGAGIRQKLALRGITEGVELKVISSRGPITIKLDGNLITIGRGVAGKVKVREL